MKYKKGDKLKRSDNVLVIQEVIGDLYVGLCTDVGSTWGDFFTEKEIAEYTLITPEIPKDGVPVKVTNLNNVKEVRISSGKVDENGNLLCYCDSEFIGETYPWKDSKWEVI